MRTIKIPIIESKLGAQAKLFNKLSPATKNLFVIIARLAKTTNGISLDDIRNLNIFGTTSEIEELLYTLESRGMGEIRVIGAETYFIPNKVFATSVL